MTRLVHLPDATASTPVSHSQPTTFGGGGGPAVPKATVRGGTLYRHIRVLDTIWTSAGNPTGMTDLAWLIPQGENIWLAVSQITTGPPTFFQYQFVLRYTDGTISLSPLHTHSTVNAPSSDTYELVGAASDGSFVIRSTTTGNLVLGVTTVPDTPVLGSQGTVTLTSIGSLPPGISAIPSVPPSTDTEPLVVDYKGGLNGENPGTFIDGAISGVTFSTNGTPDGHGNALWAALAPASFSSFTNPFPVTLVYGGKVARPPLVFDGDLYNGNLDFGSFPQCVWGGGTRLADQQISFACADFNGSQFYGFGQCNPGYLDFSYANLTNCRINSFGSFGYTSFTEADCSGSLFTDSATGSATHIDFTNANLSNCTFLNIDFQGVSFIGANLTGAQFINCTWEGTRTNQYDGTVFWDSTTKWPAGFDPSIFPVSRSTFYDYSGQTLTGTDMSYTFHAHANFKNAILTDVLLGPYCGWADFSGAQLLGDTLYNSYPAMMWANLKGATIDLGRFHGGSSPGGIGPPSLAHASLEGVQFTWTGQSGYPAKTANYFGNGNGNFAYCNFNGIKNPPGCLLVFLNCNTSYSTFVGARLYDLNEIPVFNGISESTMCYCDFTDCVGGWFQEAVLVGSTFKGADLTWSCFTEANLCDVDLSGAIVNDAAFDSQSKLGNLYLADPGATLRTFSGGWVGYDLPATYNSKTKLPAGINMSQLLPAITDPLALPPYQQTWPLSDFTGQTLTPTQYPPGATQHDLRIYDGNLQSVTFDSPNAYNNLGQNFNTNFGKAKFLAGRFPQGLYECNLGNPPLGGARGQATSTPGPPLVRHAPTVHLHLPDATVSTNPR